MTKSCVIILAALMSRSAAAEESSPRTAVPQPRVRLDPNSHTAIPAAKKEDRKESAVSAVAMSPMVVRSTVVAAEDPQQQKQPEGPFSILEGGRITRKDLNGVRIEVGVWPYRNILWKNDRFKSDLKHVGTEFVRATW